MLADSLASVKSKSPLHSGCDGASHPHWEDGPVGHGKMQCSGERHKEGHLSELLHVRLLSPTWLLSYVTLTLFLSLSF